MSLVPLLEYFWVLIFFPPLFFLVLNLLSLFQCGTVGFQDLMIVKIFTVELFKFSSMTEDMHFNNLDFLVQLAVFSALSSMAEKGLCRCCVSVKELPEMKSCKPIPLAPVQEENRTQLFYPRLCTQSHHCWFFLSSQDGWKWLTVGRRVGSARASPEGGASSRLCAHLGCWIRLVKCGRNRLTRAHIQQLCNRAFIQDCWRQFSWNSSWKYRHLPNYLFKICLQ